MKLSLWFPPGTGSEIFLVGSSTLWFVFVFLYWSGFFAAFWPAK